MLFRNNFSLGPVSRVQLSSCSKGNIHAAYFYVNKKFSKIFFEIISFFDFIFSTQTDM